MNELIFTHKDVMKIYPWIKPRTLMSWVDAGIVTPDYANANGRGSKRLYSLQNLIEIGAIAEMLRLGLPRKHVTKIMKIARIRANAKHDSIIVRSSGLSGIEVKINLSRIKAHVEKNDTVRVRRAG